jgi:hypothetical protein
MATREEDMLQKDSEKQAPAKIGLLLNEFGTDFFCDPFFATVVR